MPKRNKAQYFELIKKHGLEITIDDYYGDDDDDEFSQIRFCVFPWFDGGMWGCGESLEEAIENCLKLNKLEK